MKINARSSPSAAIAAIMALKTKAAGPSLQSFSKMDPIAHSKHRVSAVLRAFLIGAESCHVLPVCNLQAQSAAVGLRCKTADLIHDREILCPRSKGNISRKAPVAPMCKRKSKARDS